MLDNPGIVFLLFQFALQSLDGTKEKSEIVNNLKPKNLQASSRLWNKEIHTYGHQMAGSLFYDYNGLCVQLFKKLIFKHVNMFVCLTLGTAQSFIFNDFFTRNFSLFSKKKLLYFCMGKTPKTMLFPSKFDALSNY